jgi:hypothetical protein
MNRASPVRHWWPVLAQVSGVVMVAVGFGVLAVWAGLVAAGVGLVAVGTIAELDQS